MAARFSSFPILLETYRECMRDVFDLPAAAAILAQIQRGAIRVTTRRVGEAVAVRFVAAVLLHRELYL